jgi:hypothetical protein
MLADTPRAGPASRDRRRPGTPTEIPIVGECQLLQLSGRVVLHAVNVPGSILHLRQHPRCAERCVGRKGRTQPTARCPPHRVCPTRAHVIRDDYLGRRPRELERRRPLRLRARSTPNLSRLSPIDDRKNAPARVTPGIGRLVSYLCLILCAAAIYAEHDDGVDSGQGPMPGCAPPTPHC